MELAPEFLIKEGLQNNLGRSRGRVEKRRGSSPGIAGLY